MLVSIQAHENQTDGTSCNLRPDHHRIMDFKLHRQWIRRDPSGACPWKNLSPGMFVEPITFEARRDSSREGAETIRAIQERPFIKQNMIVHLPV